MRNPIIHQQLYRDRFFSFFFFVARDIGHKFGFRKAAESAKSQNIKIVNLFGVQ